MRSIAEFFEKIKSARAKEAFIRTVVQSALKEAASIEVPLEAISISSSIITLKGIGQAARAAAFIKKPAILREINTRQAVRDITDLR